MPTYTYLCEIENREFEEFHSISEIVKKCPVCKEAGRKNHKPKRLISGPTAGRVELTGHDLVAKTKSDAKKLEKEIYSSESAYANLVGESTYQGLQSSIDKRKRGR